MTSKTFKSTGVSLTSWRRGEIFLTHLSHPCHFWKLEQSKGKHGEGSVGAFLPSEPSGREGDRDQNHLFCCGKWFCLGCTPTDRRRGLVGGVLGQGIGSLGVCEVGGGVGGGKQRRGWGRGGRGLIDSSPQSQQSAKGTQSSWP